MISLEQPPLPQNAIPLAPLQSDGKPPTRRIRNAADAQTLVTNLWQAAQQRNLRNAAIQGQIDGNPPYNQTKLRAAGRGGDPNFNTLEAKALVSTALVPYYDLFAGATHYVDIRCDYGSPTDRTRWSGIVTEEYDRMLRTWRNFDYTMQQMLRDYVVFGKGFLAWDDMRSWRFQKVAYYRVLVPDSTSIDLDSVELIVLLQDWPVSRLYGKIRNEKIAHEAGWNIDATLAAIAGAVPTDPSTPNDPIAAQQLLRDNDLYVSSRSAVVQTATIFVKEFDGKWSEMMIRRDSVEGTTPYPKTNKADAPANFLFKSFSRYERIAQLINPFFFEVMDGSWNGASGLGRDIFTIMQLKDRIACTQAHAVFLRNSLVLQPKQALDKQRLNVMQVGAVTWVPEGANVLESQILGDITSTIEVSRELTTMTERNTGIYRPTLEKGPGNPQTLGEFQAKFAQATVLSTSAVNRFYAQMDRLYEEQYRRVNDETVNESMGDWAKEVLAFRQRCKERGVPPEALKKVESIRAWRNIGNGSAGMRQQVLGGFMSIYPYLPADGQQNLIQDFISVSSSQAQVDRYMPREALEKLPTDQQELAMLENAAMKIGAPVTWTPSQNNIIHAQTHLQSAAQAAASLQQGANMADVTAYLDALGSHTVIHLQRESANPTTKNEVKVLTQQWNQLASLTDQLKQRLQSEADDQAQLQQQAQQQMTELDLKRMTESEKLAISREKAAGTMALKKERQDAEIALKARQVAANIGMSDTSNAAKIMLDQAKTKSDIVMKQAVAASAPSNSGE